MGFVSKRVGVVAAACRSVAASPGRSCPSP